jgi:hypothetical protein
MKDISNQHLLEPHPDLLNIISGFENKSLLNSTMQIYTSETYNSE